MTADFQQQGNGVLGDGIGAIVWHIAKRHSVFAAAIHVGGIVAGGHDADEFYVGTGIRQSGRQVGPVAYDNVSISHTAHNFLQTACMGVEHGELAEFFKLLVAQIPQIDDAAIYYAKLHTVVLLLIEKCGCGGAGESSVPAHLYLGVAAELACGVLLKELEVHGSEMGALVHKGALGANAHGLVLFCAGTGQQHDGGDIGAGASGGALKEGKAYLLYKLAILFIVGCQLQLLTAAPCVNIGSVYLAKVADLCTAAFGEKPFVGGGNKAQSAKLA